MPDDQAATTSGRPLAAGVGGPTYFEITTAMAMLHASMRAYFEKNDIDADWNLLDQLEPALQVSTLLGALPLRTEPGPQTSFWGTLPAAFCRDPDRTNSCIQPCW